MQTVESGGDAESGAQGTEDGVSAMDCAGESVAVGERALNDRDGGGGGYPSGKF